MMRYTTRRRGRFPTGLRGGRVRNLFTGSFVPLHERGSHRRLAGSSPRPIRHQFTLLGRADARRRTAGGLANVEFIDRLPEADLRTRIARPTSAWASSAGRWPGRPEQDLPVHGQPKPVITADSAIEEFFRDGAEIRLCGEPLPETARRHGNEARSVFMARGPGWRSSGAVFGGGDQARLLRSRPAASAGW
jgi:hypothetical protein